MIQNNLNDGMEYHYFDISYDGSKWTVWFYRVAQLKEVLTPVKKGVK